MWMNYDYSPVLRDNSVLGGTTAPVDTSIESTSEATNETAEPMIEKSIKTDRSNNGFIQRKRLKILEAIYQRDKYTAVKSYIGTDANVLSIVPLNYVTDNYTLVDLSRGEYTQCRHR